MDARHARDAAFAAGARGGRGRGLPALLAACVAGSALAAGHAAAVIVAGGGSPAADCLAVFDAPANTPAARPRRVVCVDGDPTCDGDGIVNGSCQIAVSVCLNSTALATCNLVGVDTVVVDHSADNGDPKFDPDFQALQSRIDNNLLFVQPNANPDDCTSPTNIRIPIKGPLGSNRCGRSTKKIRVTAVSDNFSGKVYTDRDKLRLVCVPAADADGGCDPQVLFADTFDRIQRQVFNQSCAVSSCHDSQTHQSSLILEAGASYTDLVNAAPVNSAAQAAAWLRVLPGDRVSSYLYRKITGDLPDAALGVRMPYHRAALHTTLREVVGLWIDAGAPQSGWVPGTD